VLNFILLNDLMRFSWGALRMTHDNAFIVTLDDDPMVSRILELAIGVRSQSYRNLQDYVAARFVREPMAVFIDIHLGIEENGLDVIPDTRKRWPYTPIIVVTSDPNDEALELSFRRGADDFLLKPIKPREAQARFRTRLSEAQDKASKSALGVGDLFLDTAHKVISGPNGKQFLAPVETLMLAQLIKARGTVVPKEILKREAWGPVSVSDNAFYRKLFELRRALQVVTESVKIQSVYGEGLSLEIKIPEPIQTTLYR
jgi:DNA-binding response OmpR family regulator